MRLFGNPLNVDDAGKKEQGSIDYLAIKIEAGRQPSLDSRRDRLTEGSRTTRRSRQPTREFLMRKFLLWPGAALLAATLAACGGGGGSDDGGVLPAAVVPAPTARAAIAASQTAVSAAQVADFDLAGSYANYLAGSAQYTVSGRATGLGEVVTVIGWASFSAPVASSFNGMPTLRKTTSVTLVGTDRRGVSQTQTASTERHYDSNYQQIATVLSGATGSFGIVTMAPLPARVQPGASGEWSRSIVYSDAALTQVISTTTTRYTVQREGDTTAILSVIDTTVSGGVKVEVTDRYRLGNDRSMRQISQSIDSDAFVSNVDFY